MLDHRNSNVYILCGLMSRRVPPPDAMDENYTEVATLRLPLTVKGWLARDAKAAAVSEGTMLRRIVMFHYGLLKEKP